MDTDTTAHARLEGLDPDEARAFRIERAGALDIEFHGWILGVGEHGTGGIFSKDWTRGIIVSIYMTKNGALVTSSKRWSRWQGEQDKHTAAVHESAGAALAWLRADASAGELGPASKDAWEQACDTAPGLKGQDVEQVA